MRTPRRLVHGQPPSLNEAMKGLRCLASFRSHHPPKPNPWWWWRVQTIRKKPESLCLKPLKWEKSSVKIVSPDKDSETTILRRYTDARLAVGSLEAMGRGSTCGREESEQERETREDSDQPYFDMHW